MLRGRRTVMAVAIIRACSLHLECGSGMQATAAPGRSEPDPSQLIRCCALMRRSHGNLHFTSDRGTCHLDAWGLLVPLVERLDVDGADLGMAALLQDADEWPPMKPPAPVTTTRSFLDTVDTLCGDDISGPCRLSRDRLRWPARIRTFRSPSGHLA
jgi:hypothetical protein